MSERIPIDSVEEQRIRRFLLGEVRGTERAALQERYFLDEDYFNQVRYGEAELIDAYVRGELPANEVEPARRFVTESSQTPRLAFARALAASAAEHDEDARTEEAVSGGAARRWWLFLPVVLLAGWLGWDNLGLRKRMQGSPATFEIQLPAGGVARLASPAGVKMFALRLGLPANAEGTSFEVEVRPAGGEPVWRQRAEASGTPPRVIVWTPAEYLPRGSYEAVAMAPGGGQPLANYYFQLQ